MGDYAAIDVDIDYKTPKVEVFRTNYLPQHLFRLLSYDIDCWGISLTPAWMPEALPFDHIIVYRHILYGLEKWYLYT